MPIKQIGHHQRHEHDEQQQPEAVRPVAVAEVLHLGDVAVALAEGPQPRADEKEGRGDHQRCRRRHQRENADSRAVRLPGPAEQREGGHVGAEQRHQQHEGADGSGCQEVVFARSPKEPVAEASHHQHEQHVDTDDGEGHRSPPPSAGLRRASLRVVFATRCVDTCPTSRWTARRIEPAGT